MTIAPVINRRRIFLNNPRRGRYSRLAAHTITATSAAKLALPEESSGALS